MGDARSNEDLLNWFREGEPCVGVVGLGYVGLPLSLAFAEAGLPVIGFDVDEPKLELLRKGDSYLSTVSASKVMPLISSKAFRPTSDFTQLSECDAILICVPTPLGEANSPDLKYVRMTSEQCAETLRANQLVVLESTTYPGTTEEVVRDILERTNLKCGEDFWLAFSPEREDPGNPDFTTSTIPKVVGGLEEYSGELAEILYRRAFKNVVRVSHARVAEAAKLLENIYRAVNIALVNELKVVFDAMNIDVWEVIEAAKTKPFGFQAFYPGPGLGGHCIPIDPFYLTWRAAEYGVSSRFIELAGEVNRSMPDYVVARVADALNEAKKPLNGSSILLVGVAYKGGVSDTRESPGLTLIHKLQAKGAKVEFHDPMVPELQPTRKYNYRMKSVELDAERVKSYDAVLVSVTQPEMDLDLIAENASLIVDTRNAFASYPDAKVVKA